MLTLKYISINIEQGSVVLLSKCPNCRSRFEIDEAQLSVADGLVRCGACLHVFNGRESANQTPSEEQLSGIDRELEAIEAEIKAIEKNRTQPKPRRSLDDELADFSANLTSPFQDQASLLPDDVDSFDIVPSKPEQFSTEEYQEPAWASNGTTQESASINTPKKPSKLEEDINDFFAFSDTIQHQGSGSQGYATGQLRPSAKDGFIPHSSTPLNSLSIDDEPLSLEVSIKNKRQVNTVNLALIAIAVALVGFGAYITTQFNRLALDPETRPKIAMLCNIIQCTLPKTYSTSFLKVTSRSTREVGDKLEVDAIIFNTNNKFDMPFPNVIMKFSDLNDKLIAEFTVTPDEYRQGELLQLALFPSNTTAHIKFDLPSPGKESVSFNIDFHYPDNLKSN